MATPTESMREKTKKFLNSLTNEETHLFWRFLRGRIWPEWVDKRVHHEKIV